MGVCVKCCLFFPPKFTGKCPVWVRQWDAKAQLEATHTPWEATRAGQSNLSLVLVTSLWEPALVKS